LFAFLSVALLLLLAFIVYRETHHEWESIQKTYYGKLSDKLGKPELRATPIHVKQIWLPQLNTTDRCMTCHLGFDNPKFADEPEPLTTHPGDYLRNHPVDKFGCTSCHQGDGQAVTFKKTHGPVHHLNRQLLAKEYVQASCTKCHTDLYDRAVTAEIFPDAATFLTGRELTYKLGCRGCHTIQAEGGNIGPPLSYFGSRKELAFLLIHDFTHLEGPHTMAQWEYEHFLNPQKITPGNPVLKIPPTIMPNFGLKPEEARALSIYVLGLRNPKVENMPVDYLPQKTILQVVAERKSQTAAAK
jgi:cytochrome c2